MRRKLISTLLCVSMAVTMLTGCGGKESSSASGTEGTNTSSKEDASSENADGEEADSETEVVKLPAMPMERILICGHL